MVANKKDGGTAESGTMVVAHRAGIQVCLVVVVFVAIVLVVVAVAVAVAALVSLCGRK